MSEELSPEAYHVCREGGTEPPFSGEYLEFKGDGVYGCVACGHLLFDSETKYDSGTGWPSFWEAEEVKVIGNEVRCPKCDAHLGHVFPDGPEPTGERYCINSVALKFEERK